MNSQSCVIGIDVGGTNTDAVIMKGRRVLSYSKQATTWDVTSGVLKSLFEALRNCEEKEIRLQQINIGTTHFINAVIQRSSELSKVVVLRLAKPPCTEAMPPFYDFPNSLRQIVDGGWKLLNGGYEFDGREISSINETEIRDAVQQSISKGLNHFVLSGVFSPIKGDQENRARNIILSTFPNASVTAAHELGHLGILERENAAILNECLKDLAKKTLAKLKAAIANKLALTCPLFLTQNDGTVCSIEQAMEFPIFTFASGPTNSMRGAAFVSGIQNAVVVDIGGTSTDVGMLIDGFPKEANFRIDIGGVPTFFHMPLTYSIGLGGGSIINKRDKELTIGPESVGYRLTKEAICFGGKTLTTTDVAVAFGQAPKIVPTSASISDRISGLVDGNVVLDIIQKKVEMAIDSVKSDKNPVPVVLVGGGAILVDANKPMVGCSEIIRAEHSQIANAIGAALCQVSGSVDVVAAVDPNKPESRRVALQDAKERAIKSAISNGAIPDSVKITECMELPLTYSPGNAVQYKVRAIGDLAVDKSKSVSMDVDAFRHLKYSVENGHHVGNHLRRRSLSDSGPDHDLGPIREITDAYSPFDERGEWILTRYDIECVVIGAGILGCGGGGNPHAGKIRLLHILNEGKNPRVVTPDRLLSITPNAEKCGVIAFGMMGAPVCFAEKHITRKGSLIVLATMTDIYKNPERYEKLPRSSYEGGVTYSDNVPIPEDALEAISNQAQSRADSNCRAVMPFEVGGANTMEPLAVSAEIGLPCVDIDGMGRAYPELQNYTPYVYGVDWNPVVQGDEFGRVTVSWTANTAKDAENFHRHICVENGCKSNLAVSFLPLTKMKEVCVQNSISRAWKVGKAVLDSRKHKTSPVEAVVKIENGKLMCKAKIVDVQRHTEGGFNRGYVWLEDLQNNTNEWLVVFQNENLVLKRNEIVIATVPDLICILDVDSGEPITTENLRYGLRVAVIILPPSPMLTSEVALPVFGPRAFGLGIDYKSDRL